jgi:DNA-binding NarL/FixJ family response regulator
VGGEGQPLSADEAIHAATSLGKTARSVPVLPGGLSPREREVAVLITRGLTNRQIAAWGVEHGLR